MVRPHTAGLAYLFQCLSDERYFEFDDSATVHAYGMVVLATEGAIPGITWRVQAMYQPQAMQTVHGPIDRGEVDVWLVALELLVDLGKR